MNNQSPPLIQKTVLIPSPIGTIKATLAYDDPRPPIPYDNISLFKGRTLHTPNPYLSQAQYVEALDRKYQEIGWFRSPLMIERKHNDYYKLYVIDATQMSEEEYVTRSNYEHWAFIARYFCAEQASESSKRFQVVNAMAQALAYLQLNNTTPQ